MTYKRMLLRTGEKMNIKWMIGSKENILMVADLLNDKYIKHSRRF